MSDFVCRGKRKEGRIVESFCRYGTARHFGVLIFVHSGKGFAGQPFMVKAGTALSERG
jgi:hypothetical protein